MTIRGGPVLYMRGGTVVYPCFLCTCGVICTAVSTTLSARVKRLNPSWNEEGVDVDARFQDAVELTGTEFKQKVKIQSSLPSKRERGGKKI